MNERRKKTALFAAIRVTAAVPVSTMFKRPILTRRSPSLKKRANIVQLFHMKINETEKKKS